MCWQTKPQVRIYSFTKLLSRVRQGLKLAGTHRRAVLRPGDSAIQHLQALARACVSGNTLMCCVFYTLVRFIEIIYKSYCYLYASDVDI